MTKNLKILVSFLVVLIVTFSGCSDIQSNGNPKATCSADSTSGQIPLTVSFLGTGTDTDGTIARYFWAFGDGFTSEEQNPVHVFNEAGEYTVRLTVIDDNGNMGSETIIINATDTFIPTLDDIDFVYWINDNVANLVLIINQITDSINNESFESVQGYCETIANLWSVLPYKMDGFTVSIQLYPLGNEFLSYLDSVYQWSGHTYGWIVSYERDNIDEANERMDMADYYGNLSIGYLDNITKMIEPFLINP